MKTVLRSEAIVVFLDDGSVMFEHYVSQIELVPDLAKLSNPSLWPVYTSIRQIYRKKFELVAIVIDISYFE